MSYILECKNGKLPIQINEIYDRSRLGRAKTEDSLQGGQRANDTSRKNETDLQKMARKYRVQ